MNARNTYVRMTIAAALFAAIPFSEVYALVQASPSATPTPTATTQVSAGSSAAVTALKAKGMAEIDRRITRLTAAFDKLNTSAKLSAADKAALTTQITAELAGLAGLKTKLAADTTLAEARADVVSIVTEYRVYALILPKVRLATAIDRLTVVESQLTDIAARFEAEFAAHTPTAAQTAALAELKTKTTAAKAKIEGVSAKLIALTPTDYNADHAILNGYRATLAAALADMKAARAAANTLVKTLPTPSPVR